jgi:hypothetical protein
MRYIILLVFISHLGSCSSFYNSNLNGKEFLCTFNNASNELVDFSLKFSDNKVHIISWWIDRKYKDLVIDYQKGESDIFREYNLNKSINILGKNEDFKNKAYLKIDNNTLRGEYTNNDFERKELKCYVDPRASYKMSLKIAIGKKNYAAYAKQKGFK